MNDDEIYSNKDFFSVDITRMTPLERVLEVVRRPQRPGKACMMSSGFIHEDELSTIAKVLNVSEEQLKENLLEKRYAYNKHVHKPKLIKHKKKEHLPYGKCVFLEESSGGEEAGHKCRLGKEMPLHCRLSTSDKHGFKLHLWYMLNYIIDPEDPDAVRQWAIYLKSHPTIPGGELRELVPEEEKLRKMLNLEQESSSGQD